MLTQWYEPEPGPAALPSGLARELAARGHELRVVTGYPNYPSGEIAQGYRQRRRHDETLGGVEVRRVALYPSHGRSLAKRVANYGSFAASAWASGLDALAGVDVVWVNYSPVTIGLPMLALQRRHQVPTVVHVLDLWPDTVTASGLGGSRAARLEGPLHRWCDRIYRAAHTVAYISPGVGEVLAARGVPRDKLAYAPMWADESVHRPRSTPLHRGWGLSDGSVALVYAGALGGAQELSTLIRACAELSGQGLKCLVAGSGTHDQELRRLAADLSADNVTFLGRLSPEEASDLSAAADIHYVGLNAHPLARVTTPSKLQAALASGRPVVGSLLGDAARVVARSGGWTSPPGDVASLLANLREALALGRSGLHSMRSPARALYDEEFSLATGADRIEGLLEAAAGGRVDARQPS